MMSTNDLVNRYIDEADAQLNEQRIEVDNETISILMLQDTTKLSLEGLAKVYVNIDFEIYKLQLMQDKYEKMEIRRLFAFQKVIKRLMQDILSYRERMNEKYPGLLEKESECIG